MAVNRPPIKTCSNCSNIDRETYRGAKVAVCYLVQKVDNEPVAITVTDKTAACGYWRQHSDKKTW